MPRTSENAETPQLVNLVYMSFATHEFSEKDLLELLKKARSFNGSHDVSGILVYRDGIFLQYLEGTAANVELVYSRIQKDKRHESLSLIFQGDCTRRIFPDWDMHYVPSDSLESSWLNTLFQANIQLRRIQNSPDRVLETLERIRLRALDDQAS